MTSTNLLIHADVNFDDGVVGGDALDVNDGLPDDAAAVGRDDDRDLRRVAGLRAQGPTQIGD